MFLNRLLHIKTLVLTNLQKHQLTECFQKELLSAMTDREGWLDRVKGIYAIGVS